MTGWIRSACLSLALVLSACGAPPESADAPLPPPDVLRGTARAFLVDVRSPEAWQAGHSAVATSIPRDTPDFAARVVALTVNPDNAIYLYAASDAAAAEAARAVRAEARRQRLPVTVVAAGSFEAIAASGAPVAQGPTP